MESPMTIREFATALLVPTLARDGSRLNVGVPWSWIVSAAGGLVWWLL